jgi:hypothetical protein
MLGLKKMKIWKSHALSGLVLAALLLAGCKPGARTALTEAAPPPAAPETNSESQRVAEAVLGKQAEVVAHGDLARNGLEQVVVVNRTDRSKPVRVISGISSDNSTDMLITRAVIVQKNNDKWAEVLRCDEHVKNPRGYLGGSPTAPASGWRLKISKDSQTGLELRFTPSDAGRGLPSEDETGARTMVVRWNTNTKRYQSLDQSHREYQDEVPALETPRSILK